ARVLPRGFVGAAGVVTGTSDVPRSSVRRSVSLRHVSKLVGVPTVGMVGGGQLARMTHQAGIALGVHFRVLAEGPEVSAARVARDVTVGDYRDLDTLLAFAAGCDVVTFDHEHVPSDHLVRLEKDGVVCRPGAEALI